MYKLQLKDDLTLSSKEKCLNTLEVMYLTRFMDDKMSKLVRQNKGGTFHLSVAGHEMIGAACALGLTPGKDWGLPYYRDRAFAIGIGSSLKDILGAFLARAVPHHSGGRMMPEHFSHKGLRLPCQSSCVGSQFLQAVGVAKGIQLSGKDELVYVSAGDGATSQGDFHEALNFSCLHRLGVIFVIQDNGWAISVPVLEQTAGGSIAQVARGYEGLAVFDIDGCNFEQVSMAVTAAVEKGRKGEGPSLIIAKVPRLGPHSSSDDPSKYKDEQTIANEKARDPIPLYENWLVDMGLADVDTLKEMRDSAFKRIELAAQEADQIPFPDPSSAAVRVFKETKEPFFCPVAEESESSSSQESIVMVDALNHALEEEMKIDPHVVVFGQDVAHGKGGVFGVTRNLTAKFGPQRCFNTPLAESTIIALALGMSVVGKFKPVAEIQFADYMWTGVNQLFNELANIYYRSNGEWNCPVVIRMPYGGYIQGGPYHSQSIEAFLAHCPGLKVVIPSNAADAKRLLKTAIRDPNPVVFLEHKALYRQRVFCARKEPDEQSLLPFGKAKVVRKGADVTVVCWGMMVFMANEVAETLSQEGISVEIIDLRTIVPLDIETVLSSVRKCGKVLIAHEAARNCGFGAEISARIVESAFNYLDAPVMRVAGEDCMVPYCKLLEDEVLPQARDLEEAIRKLAHF
ncbi:MAG TPA: thiamine pyrophosphate-dependent enzyme [Rhabdochlamydiaceae bacterium]|nr:thiamine pyrophosphate-dependent enzyme [Rhabdochlamydiaceae bacterium]